MEGYILSYIQGGVEIQFQFNFIEYIYTNISAINMKLNIYRANFFFSFYISFNTYICWDIFETKLMLMKVGDIRVEGLNSTLKFVS